MKTIAASINSHASDSLAQRETEPLVLKHLNDLYDLSLTPQTVKFGDSSIQVDGIDHGQRVLTEIYSHVGKLKPAQKHKVASDILKLIYAEKAFGNSWRKIICFVCSEAAAEFKGKSWLAQVANSYEIEIQVADIGDDALSRVTSAQKRQQMINKE